MLRQESESSPWMSGFTPPCSSDYTSLPRCAVLSFHREGDTVHWKPWRLPATPSPPLTVAKLPSDTDQPDTPSSSRDAPDGVIDFTTVLALAVQQGMAAQPPPRRLFGWPKTRRPNEPDSAGTESSIRSGSMKECAWVGPTRLSLDTARIPRTPDTPVSYREFVPPATPLDLALVAQGGQKSHRLDSRGIALIPARAQSNLSDSMVVVQRKEGTPQLKRARKSRGKRIYHKLRKLWPSPTADRSRRTWPSLRMRTSPDIHSEKSDDDTPPPPAPDVYLQFMSQ